MKTGTWMQCSRKYYLKVRRVERLRRRSGLDKVTLAQLVGCHDKWLTNVLNLRARGSWDLLDACEDAIGSHARGEVSA